MKSKLISVYTILLVISLNSLYGQTNCFCKCSDETESEPLLSGELFAQELQVNNFTYINKNWLLGDIFLSDGEIIRNKYLKYNGLLDELLWLEPKSQKTIILDKTGIRQFHFLNFEGDTSVYFQKIIVKRDILSDSSEIFGQELFHGKLSLFVFLNFFVEQRELVTTSLGLYQKTNYAKEPVYYFKFMNNNTVGFKSLNRKKLYAFLPDKKDQIKKFCKEKKLVNFKTDSDLIRLTQFLSSILSP